MAENEPDSGAFVFVDASTDEADKSYGGGPAHPYVFKAWEWLLERTLRRKLVLSLSSLERLTPQWSSYRTPA